MVIRIDMKIMDLSAYNAVISSGRRDLVLIAINQYLYKGFLVTIKNGSVEKTDTYDDDY